MKLPKCSEFSVHTPYAESVSPTPVTNCTRYRAAPLSSLHTSLYRPSNYQAHRRHIATPAGDSSRATAREREAATLYAQRHDGRNNKSTILFSSHETPFFLLNLSVHDPSYYYRKHKTTCINKCRYIKT